MLRAAFQTNREIAVFTPLGDDLVLRRFDGCEAVSSLFEFELEIRSDDSALSAADIVGRNVTWTLRTGDHGVRYFNGYVNRFSHVSQDDLASTYRATVVPWLWFLTQTTDCRIFQDLTVPQIIQQIFADLGFTDFRLELIENYQPREYCVQYRESDFAFVSRLMEEEGVSYWFEHENGRHTLVLADSLASHTPMDQPEVDYGDPEGRGDLTEQLTEWNREYRFHSGRVAYRDYNFQTPRDDLASTNASTTSLPNIEVFEKFDYPGIYGDKSLGEQRAKVRMQSEETKFDNVSAAGTYRDFAAGRTFTVASHLNRHEVGREYFVSKVHHHATVGDSYRSTDSGNEEPKYENRFSAMPADVIFRPEQSTRRPIVEGIQTAKVVGPPGEEIHTDSFGRVKVQFPWDREGNEDDKSSCWMRVSQVHAGHGWGNMDLPRVGEEVVVSFLEGNPDRPMIKGRVYNGNNRPPFKLPEGKTRSDGKTDTYQGSGYNEMSMDDTPGNQQLRVNAQHNMDSNVNNSETLTVGVDRSADIGNNDTIRVGVDSTEEVGSNKSETVGNDYDIDVASDIEIVAGTSITLACGASTIHMNQAGVITISGQFITSAAMAANTIIAPMTEVSGGKMLTQAAPVCMDISGIKHINGKETIVSGSTVEAKGDTVVVKGAPIKIGEAGAPMAEIPAPESDAAGGGPASPEGPAEGGSGGGGNGEQSAEGPQGPQAESEPAVAEGTSGTQEDSQSGDQTNDSGNFAEGSDESAEDGSSDAASNEAAAANGDSPGSESSEDGPSENPGDTAGVGADGSGDSSGVDGPGAGPARGGIGDSDGSIGAPADSQAGTAGGTGTEPGVGAGPGTEAGDGGTTSVNEVGDDVAGASSRAADKGLNEIDQHERVAAEQADQVKSQANADAQRLEGQAQAAETKAANAAANEAAAQRRFEESAQSRNSGEFGEAMEASRDVERASAERLGADAEASNARRAADQALDHANDLPSGSDMTTVGKAAKYAKNLSTLGDVVQGGVGLYTAGQQYQAGDNRGAAVTLGETGGNIGGGAAGAWAGAVVGFAVCGPPCAVVGGLAVGYMGGEVGEHYGGRAAGAIHDAVATQPTSPPPQTYNPPPPQQRIPMPPNECFGAAVGVHTDRGLIPMADVKVGDVVLAYDEQTGDVTHAKVTKTSENPSEASMNVRLGGRIIHTTPGHRWHTTDSGWTRTSELARGMGITSIDGGSAIIEHCESIESNELVYNLEVQTYHNYFIGNGWLVHNAVRHSGNVFK